MTDLDARLARLSPEKRALLMQQLGRRRPGETRREIVRRARPARLPLSFAQQRLWILEQLDPGSAVYNVPMTQWLHGALDAGVLRRALDELVRRHESLRTVVAVDADGPYQRIARPMPAALSEHDVGALPDDAREAAALALAREEAARAFDISALPLFRAVLVRTGPERHLLTLNAHHIAVDGWSLGILLGELQRLYAAYRDGEPSPLAEPELQYADFALWQRELMDSAPLRQQLDYWKDRLAGRLPVLELPGDRVRPPRQSYRGEVLYDLVPAELYGRVQQLARQAGATPFMVVLAAFKTLLMRYSGQTDLIVGAGVANRNREELESLVGFFVNTLALRADLSGDPTFRELLAQLKDTTLNAYAHQDVPIDRLMEELQVERALSHTPLFQTMLFFQNFPDHASPTPGLEMRPVNFDAVNQGTARTDLSLFAAQSLSGGLILFFEYASDLFDEDTVRGLSRHFQRLLRSAVEDPDRRLGALEMLEPEERDRLLYDWNDTLRETPVGQPLHALFRAQAARTPDAVAVACGDVRLSYAQLAAQADAVAAALAAQGVGRGALVGLFVERSPRMLAAMLGVLGAGAAYVPMDPAYPVERLAFMLEDARMALVLADDALSPSLPAGADQVLSLEQALRHPGAPPQADVAPEDPAYVIFTSGSTGRPKGVVVPHRAAVNFLASMAREPGLRADDALCAVTTLSFDIALLELMLPLTVGARIELAGREQAADGMALAALLERTGCTVMQATPATWRMLLESGWKPSAGLRMLCGGEALPRELADRLLAGGGELWNLYGPTETTVWSALERVSPEGPICVGRPIANTEIYIVDAAQRPVPAGVPGELLIGGLGVSDGYLGRPELTAEKFVPDPYGLREDGRLYRTGDLARWRRDGRIEVLGRIDHQVKLRGFRIELGEIEAVLREDPDVLQAVVDCREDRPGDRRLVAYAVPSPGRAIDPERLRQLARQRLPEYMIPSAWVALERLPLTPNGKVDRKALPAPERNAEAASYTAPRNADEAALAALWEDVLGLERVDIHADFFDLGGHSLLATQLVSRINTTFGGGATLRALFEAPSVAGFAQWLDANGVRAVGDDDLAGMLDALEGLSDAETRALLSGAAG